MECHTHFECDSTEASWYSGKYALSSRIRFKAWSDCPLWTTKTEIHATTNLYYFRLLRVLKTGVPNYFESSRAYTYKRIPVLDASTSSSDLLDKADEIVDFIASGLCHGSVLVHCQRGVSRSTTAVVLYLMRYVNLILCYLHPCMTSCLSYFVLTVTSIL
jgi:hypothetical protein